MKKEKNVKNQIKNHVKAVSTLVVSYGVAELVGYAMRDFRPDAKGVKKVFIKLGALAITGMAIKAATDYVEGEIDEVFDMVEGISIKVKSDMEEESDDVEDCGE